MVTRASTPLSYQDGAGRVGRQATEAGRHLSELLKRVQAGERITITRCGRPVAAEHGETLCTLDRTRLSAALALGVDATDAGVLEASAGG